MFDLHKCINRIVESYSHFLKENAPVAPVPDIRTDKHGWFSYFDEDGSGELSVQEVTRGLIKSYHLSQDIQSVNRLREIVANIWCIFGRSYLVHFWCVVAHRTLTDAISNRPTLANIFTFRR